MPENNAPTVDSVEENAAVDSVANVDQNPPAGGSDSKTFTADEVDAKIKARIDKQNAKHAEEMESLKKRLEELEQVNAQAEAERDALKHKQDLADWAEAAAREHGVPAPLLRGNSAEEFMEHAEAIKAALSVAPVVRDSGEQRTPPKSNKAIFNEFMNNAFN